MNALEGRRVLLVEDDYFIVEDMVWSFEASGAQIVGPAATVGAALDLIGRTDVIDGAVLDVNLHGEMAFSVADALLARNVPFVFSTGYDDLSIPDRFAQIVRFQKPVEASRLAGSLFG